MGLCLCEDRLIKQTILDAQKNISHSDGEDVKIQHQKIETEKDEEQLYIYKNRLRSVKRRIADVEYEVKNNG